MTGNESQPLAQSDGEERAGAVGLDENGKCEDMKLSLSSTDSDLVGVPLVCVCVCVWYPLVCVCVWVGGTP